MPLNSTSNTSPFQALLRGLTRNFKLKAFALGASIVLFFLVHSEEEARRMVIIDVVPLLPPPTAGKLLVSKLPDQIKVTMKGSRSRIKAVQREDFLPLQMDLRGSDSAFYYFDPASIEVPAGIEVIEVEPETVRLTWVNATNRTVAIKPRFNGQINRGYLLKQPVTVMPAEITLRGPEAGLRSIYEVYTAIIALDGLGAGKYERIVPLESLPPNVKCFQESVVKVQFEIVAEMAERIYRNLAVTVAGRGKAVFQPPRVSVTLRGPVTLLPQIDPELIKPSVDISRLAPSSAVRPQKVAVSRSCGSRGDSISPPEVLVKPR